MSLTLGENFKYFYHYAYKSLTIYENKTNKMEERSTDIQAFDDIIRALQLFGRKKLGDEIKQLIEAARTDLLEIAQRDKAILSAEVEPAYYETDIRFKKDGAIIKPVDIAVMNEPDKSKLIIDLIRKKEPQVYKYLYEYELPKIVRLVVNNSGNVESGEDIFQDSIILVAEKIYNNMLKLECTFSTYLYSVARYHWNNQLRKKNRQLVLVDEFEHFNIEIEEQEEITETERYKQIINEIESMGERCSQLLMYRYFHNYSWDEIANYLDYANAASARNQKYQCMRRIRARLKSM